VLRIVLLALEFLSNYYSPLPGPGHFLLLVQKKVTKEKDAPARRHTSQARVVPLRCSPGPAVE
jgi:hypothetical protein